MDPIFYHKGGSIQALRHGKLDAPGWYWWDETWASYYGPFATREIAEANCQAYVDEVLNGKPRRPEVPISDGILSTGGLSPKDGRPILACSHVNADGEVVTPYPMLSLSAVKWDGDAFHVVWADNREPTCLAIGEHGFGYTLSAAIHSLLENTSPERMRAIEQSIPRAGAPTLPDATGDSRPTD
jgi:hypothetical protein